MTPAGLIDVRVTMALGQIKAVFIGGISLRESLPLPTSKEACVQHSSEPEAIEKPWIDLHQAGG